MDRRWPWTSQEERAFSRNQTLWELDLRLWVSRTARNKFLLLKAPMCGVLWQPSLTNTASLVDLSAKSALAKDTLHREQMRCHQRPGPAS